ncbi:MAG: hypothetical protein K9I82_15825 [Chitinophagaceae bacterium]|nr:hypothetical protein [Chitinophagaceae bacterium]
MKHLFISFFLLLSSISFSQVLSEEERKLYDMIMEYRKEYRLPTIPLSPSLTFVAQTHVKDLYLNSPDVGFCNLHSWSSKGKWTPCCYTDNHSQAECVWLKPRELTTYKGYGYEISYFTYNDDDDGLMAQRALRAWKNSPGHNNTIINESIWKDNEWKAIGIGIFNGYAVVWFGEESED